jgi:photosystem II PsbY protein
MDLDFRIVAVLAPLAIAAGWATFNILGAAIAQIQSFINGDG